jgi:hypothetical protein
MPYREPARRTTRYLRFCVDVLTKPTSCDMPWELMDGAGCTRVCPECVKEVHDVTQMNAVDAEGFLAERMGEPPKLRLHRRPDGRLIEAECPRGLRQRRVRRLGSVFGLVVAIGAVVTLLR